MKEFLDYLNDFNALTVLIRLLAAALMGGLIGSERGRHGRAAGLRTHILICIGAAITSLTSIYISEGLGYNGDVSRISAQVISGIGFLGAGTILIRNSSIITGLTTAAGMWATAAIGITIGYGFYSGAIFATLICIVSVTLLGRFERQKRNVTNAYIELSDISYTEKVIAIIQSFDNSLVSYDIIPPKSGHIDNVGIVCNFKGEEYYCALRESVAELDGIAMVVCDINN